MGSGLDGEGRVVGGALTRRMLDATLGGKRPDRLEEAVAATPSSVDGSD